MNLANKFKLIYFVKSSLLRNVNTTKHQIVSQWATKGVGLGVLRNEDWGLKPKALDFQLIEANWPQFDPVKVSKRSRSLHLPEHGTRALEASIVDEEKENINSQKPLTHTQQAPPLPQADGTSQPLPAPVSLTPWTLGPGHAPAGLEVAWWSQVATSHLQLRSSPAHLGQRLRKQPWALPWRRAARPLPLSCAAETPGAKRQRATATSDVMASRRRQPMKQGAEKAGLGLNLVAEFESWRGGHRSEVSR